MEASYWRDRDRTLVIYSRVFRKHNITFSKPTRKLPQRSQLIMANSVATGKKPNSFLRKLTAS